MVQGRRYVEAPAVQPAPFGLLSAAVVLNDDDPHLGMGVEYQTTACDQAYLTAAECFTTGNPAPDQLIPNSGDDSNDGLDLVGADAFNVYALHRCRLIGTDPASASRQAQEKLTNGESRAIEQQFATALLADADDLTPTLGTAVSPLAGMAMLEDYARANYGGTPVLHMSPGEATVIGNGGSLNRNGGRLETILGSRIAAGGGYAAFQDIEIGSVTPDAGSHWLWVTGTVVVRLGGTDVTDMTIGAAAPKNELLLLAQRTVAVTVECISAAVLVTSPAVAASVDGGGA